jgi:hypothetical protein
MFDVQFYLFCSIACFRPVDRQVERKPLENFRDINRLVVVPASDPKDLFVECNHANHAKHRADMGRLS